MRAVLPVILLGLSACGSDKLGHSDKDAGHTQAEADAGASHDAGGSAADGGTGAGDAGLDAGTASDAAAGNDAGHAMPAMACELQISDVMDSNISITAISTPAGQGSTTHKDGHLQQQGIHAGSSSNDLIVSFDVTVGGDTPTVGATYEVDVQNSAANTGVFLQVGNVSAVDHVWSGKAGETISIAAVTPGLISSYDDVTFHFDNLVMEVDPDSINNQATGTFKISGDCKGAITK
jgi:hypothetical protein